MLHQGVRVRDVADQPEVEAGQRSRHDARARDHAEGRRSRGAGRTSAAAAAPAAPAEPEVIKKGKKDEDEDERETRRRTQTVCLRDEGDRRARQSGAELSAARGTTSASRWSTSWRGARRSAFESAPAEALIARVGRRMGPAADDRVLLVKPLTFMNAERQAIGELLRVLQDRRRRICWSSSTKCSCRSGKLRARSRGSAGGHNGLKSVIAHIGDEFRAAAARRRARATSRRDLADHVLREFETDETAEVERMIARAADAAEMFITSGIAAVMNQYQRRRSGNN